MNTKLSARFWVVLSVFGFMGQVAWVVENMYLNVFLYQMFNASPSDLSRMVAASAVTAALTTIFMGALSDRLGKRKLFISLGYVFWGISILLFLPIVPDFDSFTILAAHPVLPAATALSGITATILLDCVMTFFGSTANDAAFNAWLTDSVDSSRRGVAESVNAMMPMIAVLAVFGGFLFLNLEEAKSWYVIFTVIGLGTLAVGISGFFLLKEPALKPSEGGYGQGLIYGFLPSTVKRSPSLYLALLLFAFFNVSIQVFMPYLILYYSVALQMSNYVIVLAPATILASGFTFFGGKLYDKKGPIFSGYCALVTLSAGYLVLYFFSSLLPVFLGSLLMMTGYLSGMAIFGAAIRDRIPKGKAGRFQGIRICSQVLIPGVLGPALGAFLLRDADTILNNDGTKTFLPNESVFGGALLVLLPIFLLLPVLERGKRNTVDLTTPYQEDLAASPLPFSRYPRPQMVRDSYFCLNGPWSLSLLRKGNRKDLGTVTVPFPIPSPLSGVREEIQKGDVLIYSRTFSLPSDFKKDRVLLHCGAVDQTAKIILNGVEAGACTLPYLPFTVDLTADLREGENRLEIHVSDEGPGKYPWGKQRKKRGGMWYTPISGIWQTVWMESVPENAVTALRITPKLTSVTIEVEGGENKKTLILWGDGEAKEYPFEGNHLTISFAEPHLWSPEDPFLYRFTLLSGKDRVESYFGLREIGICKQNGKTLLSLNGRPYHFHGLLDQGYYPDGIFLPASPRAYEEDILGMKKMGFNMLRKHIKTEPELFYYDCDRLGIAVFQDMINNGPYSFLIDTALPTLGLRKGIRHKLSAEAKELFLNTARGVQDSLYNHPSVLYYTIFNEGWGQFDGDGCYEILKNRDPSRIYDATSGWFTETKSDVKSEHVYFKPVALKPSETHPLVLSEFGGYSRAIEGHVFSPQKNYGYRFFQSTKELEEGIFRLYRNEILPQVREGLSATVLTQWSDVEEETNGLITYDRKITKVSSEKMKKIAEEITAEFSNRFHS